MGHNDHFDFEFSEAIQDLVDEGMLEKGTPAYGIAQQVLHQDYESLTEKQKYIYNSVVVPALDSREKQIKMIHIMNSAPD